MYYSTVLTGNSHDKGQEKQKYRRKELLCSPKEQILMSFSPRAAHLPPPEGFGGEDSAAGAGANIKCR